jgi:hypothetical protein
MRPLERHAAVRDPRRKRLELCDSLAHVLLDGIGVRKLVEDNLEGYLHGGVGQSKARAFEQLARSAAPRPSCAGARSRRRAGLA